MEKYLKDKKPSQIKYPEFTEEDMDEVVTEFYLKGLIFGVGIMGILWFILG
ncbi:MAG: hypothetical protein WC260_04355 [Candidatus Pacearchaeota archaeon]